MQIIMRQTFNINIFTKKDKKQAIWEKLWFAAPTHCKSCATAVMAAYSKAKYPKKNENFVHFTVKVIFSLTNLFMCWIILIELLINFHLVEKKWLDFYRTFFSDPKDLKSQLCKEVVTIWIIVPVQKVYCLCICLTDS